MPFFTSTVQTPAGPFTAIVDKEEVVYASGWTSDPAQLTTLIHPTLLAEHGSQLSIRNDLGKVTKAIVAYHNGDLTAIEQVPVRQVSADFRAHAWDVLRTITAGTAITYSEFAVLSGRPKAVRAAAGACAYNAAALFVPCHRVTRVGGGLGGFRWGILTKQWLLEHEKAQNLQQIMPITL